MIALPGPASAEPAEALLPFDPVGLDPAAPPAPAQLAAVRDGETWSLSWEPVAYEGSGLEYYVYVREAAGTGWHLTAVDGDTTDLEIPVTAAPLILTVTSRVDGHESAAGEFLLMGPLPIQPHCAVVRWWLQPPPPGAIVSPQCLPPIPPE